MGFFRNIFHHFVKRPIKNVNVENRARQVIESTHKGTIAPAPKHATTSDRLEQFSKDNPDLLRAQKEKNEELDKMLHGMAVEPEKQAEIMRGRGQDTVLRTKSTSNENSEFGYFEPDTVSVGKCTIKQAITFLAEYQTSPGESTVEDIARQYKLDTGQLKHIVKHFQTLRTHIPENLREASGLDKMDIKQIKDSGIADKLPNPDR